MDTLKIDIDKGLVRMATAFHGGGGCHKDVISENIEELRHPVYADSDPTVSKMRNMGSVCGALNSGVMLIGYLFGRSRPGEDITCPGELAYELHNRFEETLGSKICSILKPIHVKTSADPSRNDPGNCGKAYRTGARLAVEVILSAREICPLCPDIRFPVQ